jgi:hypothetical protein
MASIGQLPRTGPRFKLGDFVHMRGTAVHGRVTKLQGDLAQAARDEVERPAGRLAIDAAQLGDLARHRREQAQVVGDRGAVLTVAGERGRVALLDLDIFLGPVSACQRRRAFYCPHDL